MIELFVLGLIGSCALMAWTWRVAVQRRNGGIVDVVWTFGVAALGILFLASGDGEPGRRATAAVLAAMWGLRLGIHLLIRVSRSAEDSRYAALREKWGTQANRRLFLFFQFQALGMAFFALPYLILAFQREPVNSVIEWGGLAIWMTGWLGEAVADMQLRRFKARGSASLCQEGLWKYSRHPNYFFEWLMWVGLAILCSPGPLGWLSWVCPLAMLYLLLGVTGIPATEAEALRRRGAEFRRYQETTSAFIPWPPRHR